MLTEKEFLLSTNLVLAVDPGLSGAVCCLGRGELQVRRDFKKLPDIANAIKDLSPDASHVVMEFVHAFPGQGVCSVWSFGRAAGVADGAIALSLPHLAQEEFAPQRWQNYFRAELGISKEQEFDSRSIASSLFPSFLPLFKRKKDHNTADAVLIAAYKVCQLREGLRKA